MTSRERLLTAIANGKPDRLPATTHTIQKYYLDKYEGGISISEFFHRHKLDRIDWIYPFMPDRAAGQYWSDPSETGYEGIVSDNWRITTAPVDGEEYPTTRFTISTPDGELSMVKQKNEYTQWVTENLIKEKTDLDVIAKHAPHFICDQQMVKEHADAIGDEGIVRTYIPVFDIYGQPGCWQDASVLYGIERLIMETFDDPDWVKELLGVLQQRKLTYIRSMAGAPIDLNELGGGDASTTVISPDMFNEFVAPFDAPLIEAAHEAGQRIVYHTCGGMMPILEDIAGMGPDAMETFTPPGMGADVDLAAAYERIADKVCFIGGFDQGYYLQKASVEETKAEVRRCFDAAGKDGGFIISPSDHFFDAKPELLTAFAEAAAGCIY